MALSEIETATGPGDVLTHDFSVGRRGYDPEEVHAHLRRVADRMGRLQAEVDRRRAREELLERKIASAQEAVYARVFRQLTEVMRAAEDAASRVRGAARDEGQAIVAAAREEAARIVAAARGEADQLLATARTETTRAKAERLLREATVESDGVPVFPSEAPSTAAAPPTPAASPTPAAPPTPPADDLVVSVQEPAVVRDLEELERSLRWLSEEEWETGDAVTHPAAGDVPYAGRGAAWQDRSPDLSLRLQASVLQLFAEGAEGG